MDGYPGGLGEMEFLRSYCDCTLRLPQAAADVALRALPFAAPPERAAVAGNIAVSLAEAARRLAGTWFALDDRTLPVAKSLLGPLPGPGEWRMFAHAAATVAPGAMLRRLGLGDDALPAAELLRSLEGLADLEDFVRAAASANPVLVTAFARPGRAATAAWFAGGEGAAAPFGLEEGDAAAMADITADLCEVARGLLGAYIAARAGAGRPE